MSETTRAGRTVLVPGASSGIGLETTRALARLGARVVLLVRNRGRGAADQNRGLTLGGRGR